MRVHSKTQKKIKFMLSTFHGRPRFPVPFLNRVKLPIRMYYRIYIIFQRVPVLKLHFNNR